MEISAKGDGPMIFEANQVIDGQVQNTDEIEDNFATALILIIMWYLVATTIAFLSALLCKGVKTALNGCHRIINQMTTQGQLNDKHQNS